MIRIPGAVCSALICVLSMVSTPVTAAPSAAAFELKPRQLRARLAPGRLVVEAKGAEVLVAGNLTARVLDLKGRVLGRWTHPVPAAAATQPIVVSIPLRKRAGVQSDLWRLAWSFTPSVGPRVSGIVALSEIVAMPFVSLRGQRSLVAGSRAALRITVADQLGRPIPKVRVALRLRAGWRSVVARGTSTPGGDLHLAVDVPESWAGSRAKISVRAMAGPFSGRHGSKVTIRREAQALLTTDKPIYQPGQTMHLRVLALRQPTRRPLVSNKVRFRLRDQRNTLLAEHETRTDAFGVAWTALPLSEGVRPGTYRLEAEVATDARHTVAAVRSVKVFRYQVPDFKVTLSPAQPYAQPGRAVTMTVAARYLSGQPVRRSKIKVEVEQRATVRYARGGRRCVRPVGTFTGWTDTRGKWTFTLPRNRRRFLCGSVSVPDAIQFRAEVVAPGGMRQHATRTLTVAYGLLQIAAYPEAGKLIAGVPQRIYLVAARPDGSPAKARFEVRVPANAMVPASRAKRTGKGAPPAPPKGHRILRVTTDAQGLATVLVKPPPGTLYLTVKAVDGQGHRTHRSLGLRTASARVLVRPETGVVRAGQKLRVALVSPWGGGVVHVDVKDGGQTVHTVTGRLSTSSGRVDLRIPATVDGLLNLSVRVRTPKGWRSGWAPVLVRPSRWLDVAVSTDRAVYGPGGLAQLKVRVQDESGRGRRAAVGLRIVDEAVFVLAGTTPRSEHGELLLPVVARGERLPVAGWTLPRLMQRPRAKVPPRVAHLLLARLQQGSWAPTEDTLVHDGAEDVPAYRKALAKRLLRRLRGVFYARFLRYVQVQKGIWIAQGRRKALCMGEQVSATEPGDLADDGKFPRWMLADPWGNPLAWVIDRQYGTRTRYRVTLHSMGPDGVDGNEDDLDAGPWRFTVPRLRRNKNCGVGYGSGGGGFGVGRFGARSPRVFMSRASVMGALDSGSMGRWASDSPEPRTRRDFRETLAVYPGLRTGKDGLARLTVPLADNLTTWAITALASDRQGRLGGRVARFRTFQPFSVDVRIPALVTRGDMITAQVVVRNELAKAQVVRVKLKPAGWYEPVALPDLRVQLKPGGAGPALSVRRVQHKAQVRIRTVGPKSALAVPFLVRVKRLGRFELRVEARAAQHSDAVARPVTVEAEGVKLRKGRGGMLASTRVHTLTLPRSVVPETTAVEVSLEPDVIASTWGSFEGLLRRPYGCFEQTSSTTYPNILVMRHLRSGRGHAKARARAQKYLAQGYQRLTTFEVQGSGGFSLFGRVPAQPMLTAFGLGEFHDLGTVMTVDRALIARVQKYLVGRQRADGTWRPEGSLIESGSTNPRGVLTATAYVALQLARSGYRGRPLRRALAALRRRGEETRGNAYALALSIRALHAAGRKADRGLARQWAARLAKLVLRRKRLAHWTPGGKSTLMGWGNAAAVETTSLAILALVETSTGLELVPPAVRWLLTKRSPDGAWTTTQATVLALESLLRARSLVVTRPPSSVRVSLDGQLLGTLRPVPGNRAVPVRLFVRRPLAPGRHRVRIQPVGRGKALYRVALVYNDRHAPPARGSGASQVGFAVKWSHRTAKPGDTVTVRMQVDNRLKRALDAPMAEVGIPPGLRLLEGVMRRQMKRGTLSQWERRGSRLLLYFTRLPTGRSTVTLRLQAETPLSARVPPSRFYEYYNPELSWYAPAGRIEVRSPAAARPKALSQLLIPHK